MWHNQSTRHVLTPSISNIAKRNVRKNTGNPLLCPMLHANPVIFTVIDFLRGGPAVEDTFGLARSSLGEVAKSIPLATLLCRFQS